VLNVSVKLGLRSPDESNLGLEQRWKLPPPRLLGARAC
jgi:hypothetical protein